MVSGLRRQRRTQVRGLEAYRPLPLPVWPRAASPATILLGWRALGLWFRLGDAPNDSSAKDDAQRGDVEGFSAVVEDPIHAEGNEAKGGEDQEDAVRHLRLSLLTNDLTDTAIG